MTRADEPWPPTNQFGHLLATRVPNMHPVGFKAGPGGVGSTCRGPNPHGSTHRSEGFMEPTHPTPIRLGDNRLPARFWAKVQVNEAGCWLWTASRRPNGYGQFGVEQIPKLAHRVSYGALVGGLPPGSSGLQLDHTCRVRHCVNPAHLELVTARINTARSHPAVASRTETGLCLRGHDDWYRDKRSPDSFTCRQCRLENTRQRNARVSLAARTLGISQSTLIRQFGVSTAVLTKIIEGNHGC